MILVFLRMRMPMLEDTSRKVMGSNFSDAKKKISHEVRKFDYLALVFVH